MSIDFKCPKCREEMSADDCDGGSIINCPACAVRIAVPRAKGAARPLAAARGNGLECKQCGGTMTRGTKTEGSLILSVIGVFLALGGILMFLYNWIAALILLVIGILCGRKSKSIMRCTACGYFFETAK